MKIGFSLGLVLIISLADTDLCVLVINRCHEGTVNFDIVWSLLLELR